MVVPADREALPLEPIDADRAAGPAGQREVLNVVEAARVAPTQADLSVAVASVELVEGEAVALDRGPDVRGMHRPGGLFVEPDLVLRRDPFALESGQVLPRPLAPGQRRRGEGHQQAGGGNQQDSRVHGRSRPIDAGRRTSCPATMRFPPAEVNPCPTSGPPATG